VGAGTAASQEPPPGGGPAAPTPNAPAGSAHLIPAQYGEDVLTGSRAGRSERLLALMTIAISLFAIALGAILKFAVTTTAAGIDIATVGVILMVIGAVGLAIGLWLTATGRTSADQST
jgi:hypothetical protein